METAVATVSSGRKNLQNILWNGKSASRVTTAFTRNGAQVAERTSEQHKLTMKTFNGLDFIRQRTIARIVFVTIPKVQIIPNAIQAGRNAYSSKLHDQTGLYVEPITPFLSVWKTSVVFIVMTDMLPNKYDEHWLSKFKSLWQDLHGRRNLKTYFMVGLYIYMTVHRIASTTWNTTNSIWFDAWQTIIVTYIIYIYIIVGHIFDGRPI